MDKTTLKRTIYRWRVRSALAFLAAVLVLAQPSWTSIGSGLAVAVVGLAVRGWASGHIRKEKELAVTGPYRYTRNPLYLGSLVLGLGFAFATRSWWSAGLVAAYFAAFYPLVIFEERDRMRRMFPEAYRAYEAHVPLFRPGLRPYPATDDRAWSVGLYRRNREGRALLGTILAFGLLAVRILFRP